MVAIPSPAPTISLEPPSLAARYIALALGIVSVAMIAAIGPIATRPMGEAVVFLPAYQSALVILGLVTAVLLYGEFRAGGALAILVLSMGYLFESIMVVMHTLSYPGLFAPHGVIGGSPQTTSWVWIFWHGGFVAALLVYGFMTRRTMGPRVANVGKATVIALLAVPFVVWLLVMISTWGQAYLPSLIADGDYSRSLFRPALCLASVSGIFLLWRNRLRSVVDLWLLIVLVTWAADVALSSVFGQSRFDLGWYSGRAFGLLSSVILLIVLLLENHAGQRRLAEAQRRLAQREHLQALGQLTGGVAHDFNNVLSVLGGSLDAMERHSGDRAQVKRYADIARAGLASGTTLAQQLMTFAGRQRVRRETFDLNKLLVEFEPLLRQALAREIVLELSLCRAPALATVDRGQFEAAVLNLAINARHAMNDKGKLVIRSDSIVLRAGDIVDLPSGTYTAVWVTDNGEGMTAEVAAKAVTPFFTTKKGGTAGGDDGKKGSGLGLSQVYGFVRASGGDLEIKTQRGRGTSIGMFLPTAAA